MAFVEFSLYLASRFIGNFGGIVFVNLELKKVLREVKEFQVVTKMFQIKMSIGSFFKFGSPWVKSCVIQNGRCSVAAWGIKKGFL